MATKEPMRRCVRCKTKKKGCSRGSPCERCALAGLTADECIYLESDLTYRSIKPKRKDTAPYTPKQTSATPKPPRALATHPTDSNVIVRCSRCIRTARGCSHERPCQPCREGGLSEWECRYTSASSFKVRGPGASALRKVRSLERIPAGTVADSTSNTNDHDNNNNNNNNNTFKWTGDPASGTLYRTGSNDNDNEDDENELVAKVPKQSRSLSTNSFPNVLVQLRLDRTPKGYRTPSPPTNVSPISEPTGNNWRDRGTSDSPDELTEITPRSGVPIPGTGQGLRPHGHKFAVIATDSASTSMSRNDSATGPPPVCSVEPPAMMALIPSVSQQSHANTVPESSPAVYTDDYQSSPSPYNSPQFQSSPPVLFRPIGGLQRLPSYPGGGGGGSSESSMYPPHAPYRPLPASYVPSPGPAARQYAMGTQTQHGFAVQQDPHGGALYHQQQQQQQQDQHQQQIQQQAYHQFSNFSSSPPYHQQVSHQMPQRTPAFQHHHQRQHPQQYQHPGQQQQQQHQGHMPRHRNVPSPAAAGQADREGSQSQRRRQQQQQQQQQHQEQSFSHAQAIPGRLAARHRHAPYPKYGSPSDGTPPSSSSVLYQDYDKSSLASIARSPTPSQSTLVATERPLHQQQQQHHSDLHDTDHGMFEQELAWHDADLDLFGRIQD